MDSPVIWLVLKLDHVASLPLKILGTLTKSSLLLIRRPSKSFRKELSKVALLTSYTIWNARQEPAWGSENQPLLSAWFSFILALPSAFAGFISEFLCLSPAVVVLYVFVCVQPCVEASPWLSSRPGLKCTSFCHAFCSCCLQCLNKGWYNNTNNYKIYEFWASFYTNSICHYHLSQEEERKQSFTS